MSGGTLYYVAKCPGGCLLRSRVSGGHSTTGVVYFVTGLLEVDIDRYRSPAYKVHVIMIALILLCNMIQSDMIVIIIEHVHSGLYFINTRCH